MCDSNSAHGLRGEAADATRLDAVVIGAGFGGMCMVHRLRSMGLRVQGIEAGADVGGVWYWNRYPGARCDLMSIDYSYSFSEEIQQEWTWSEQFAAQPEILAYANFVADRLDLRKDFQFDTRVEAASFDEARSLWVVRTDRGDVREATYCVMATGPLSVPKDPGFPGAADFKGQIALPRMIDGGSIVSIVANGHLGGWGGAHEMAFCGAAVGLMRSVALENMARGVRANTISVELAGLGPAADPDEVTNLALFLLSPAAAAVSGELILANHSRSLQMRVARDRRPKLVTAS